MVLYALFSNNYASVYVQNKEEFQMGKRSITAFILCVIILAGCFSHTKETTAIYEATVAPADSSEKISVSTKKNDEPTTVKADIFVNVDTGKDQKPISPYIYGVNEFVMDKEVKAFSARQGGNRYTAYNWENNYSNAGSDWQHSSDTYLSKSKSPADCAISFAQTADRKNIPYKITTLQMAGYVSADGNGNVSEEDAAPSGRFKEVVYAKNAPFDESPDLNDGYVYMDEYVNFLVTKLSASGRINGYNPDNEPALWEHTHPRVHPDKAECSELIEKSAALALAVKTVDPNAEIFGPALYGIGAYNDFQSAPDWADIKNNGGYDWFISYYLDEMAKREAENGVRLLDVLDVHYYSEARGECRVTDCADSSHESCVKARVQAARSLWDKNYIEDSWIGQWMKHCLPVINTLNESIDNYYPGTKLSFTEYSLGGGNQISGAVAQADILGVFGETGVYLATLWPTSENCDYQLSAINLYTNYDGNGASFGNTHVFAESSDIEKSYAYASIQDGNDTVLTLVVSNKSLTQSQNVEITLNSSVSYTTVQPYMISGDSYKITHAAAESVSGNSFIYTLPPMSVVQFVIT